MESEITSNPQSKRFLVIADFPRGDSKVDFFVLSSKVLGALRPLSCYYILHDRDVLDDGTLKTPHIHFVLVFASRHTKTSILNTLGRSTGLPLELFSVSPCLDLSASIRYLMHMDDPDKTQYDGSLVKTNDVEGFNRAVMYVGSMMSTGQLMDIINSCMSKRDLILKLGYEFYNRYHYTIDYLFDLSLKEGF